MIEYFDSHAHLHFTVYDNDRNRLIKKTLQESVGFINVGTNIETSKKAVKLAERYINAPIYATVGLHPIYTYDSNFHDKNESYNEIATEKFNIDLYKKLGLNNKVVAIGECGFDYFRLENNIKEIKEKQKKALLEQIKLSNQLGKPLMIHCRPSKKSMDAYEDFYQVISKEKNKQNVIMHFFAGNKNIAEKFINLGFYFTFGGVITLTENYNEIIKMIPDNKIMFETDAPYVTPLRYRGKRNEPLYIKETYKKASNILNISEEKLKNKVLKNNEQVFGINLKK